MNRRAIGIAALLTSVALAVTARAEDADAPPTGRLLPQIHVEPPAAQPKGTGPRDQGSGTGANERDGKAKSLDRLNRELKRKVDEVNPTANTPPLDAASPDTKIGVINIPGVQQQYGKNFGHSAFPYRPAPPVYTAPLGHR